MKQISKVKLGIGFAVAAFFAILPTNAFAASVKVGTEEISTSGKNAANTATYADGVLTLNGVTGNVTIEGVAVTVKTGSKTNSLTLLKSDSALTIDGKLKVTNIRVTPDSTVTTGSAATPKLSITANAVVDLVEEITVTHRATSQETDAIEIASKLCAKNGSVEITKQALSSTTTNYKVKGPVNIAAANCDGSKTPGTPDTLDAVYIYVAIFVASSAIFAYRRYLAKR
ncbi:hypothetical protein IKH83_01775 [Candidatus Saccharibacteria bacterium]|nr:hypothetical protein [Candidatus Saccharibacteria bacterium]